MNTSKNSIESLNSSYSTNSTLSFEHDFFNAPGIYIHPTAIVDKRVVLGEDVKIGPYCVLLGDTQIGARTRISAFSTIGFAAQHTQVKHNHGQIIIGSDVEIREYVSIHAPVKSDGKTIIGNHCYIMNYCHIAHDVILDERVTLINNVNLGGHTHVERNVMMMANSAAHQFCRIGAYTCITPFAGTRQDLPPFCMFTGQPAQFAGLNIVALRRAGISDESINNLDLITKLFYQDKILLDTIIAQSHSASWSNDPYVQSFISFIKNSARGVSKRCIEYGTGKETL